MIPIALTALLAFGCGDDDEDANHQVNNQTSNQSDGPPTAEPSTDSESLLQAIQDYESWDTYQDNGIHHESGHPGDIWVISYGNDTINMALDNDGVPVPEGSIVVKEEYGADGQAEADAVTVMQKLSDDMGDWYWVKATTDLQRVIAPPGMGPLEGTSDLGCIDCHGAAADDDYLPSLSM